MYFSAYRQKIQCIFSDSKQILDQNNSVRPGDYKESPNVKIRKFQFWATQFSKKLKFQLKFSEICIF